MKLTLAIATIFTFALGFHTTQTIAAPLATAKSFTDWCEQKSTLPPQTKHTVEVLLEKAQTKNCNQANQKLTHLTYLDLFGKEISDIKPLSSLTNLTFLSLNSNKISDIKPLSALTNLSSLSLRSNKISDIKPLFTLTNLTHLLLHSNKISDIKPLSNLKKLENFEARNNQITTKICPVKPESICKFD
jgi:internalin A